MPTDLSTTHDRQSTWPASPDPGTSNGSPGLSSAGGQHADGPADRIGRNLSCHLMGKRGVPQSRGSVKDRPGHRLVEAAERAGLIGRAATIVEPTSGQHAASVLGHLAARRRYRMHLSHARQAEPERSPLREYGAEVACCPDDGGRPTPDSSTRSRPAVVADTGRLPAQQYHNPENPSTTSARRVPRAGARRPAHHPFVAGSGH